MSLMRWEERLAPLDGIVAVALWVAGFIVLQGPADEPDTDSSPARALQYFTKEDGAILAGTLLFMLGTLFFLWFLGAIRTQLYTADDLSQQERVGFPGDSRLRPPTVRHCQEFIAHQQSWVVKGRWQSSPPDEVTQVGLDG